MTGAAKRNFLSQSAMSRVLERLREMFKDPLLVRSGRIYERTVRADRLLREFETVLPRLEAMVLGEEFDPASKRGTISPGIDRQCLHDSAAIARECDKKRGVFLASSSKCRLGEPAPTRTSQRAESDAALSAEEVPPALPERNNLQFRFCLYRRLRSADAHSSIHAEANTCNSRTHSLKLWKASKH